MNHPLDDFRRRVPAMPTTELIVLLVNPSLLYDVFPGEALGSSTFEAAARAALEEINRRIPVPPVPPENGRPDAG